MSSFILLCFGAPAPAKIYNNFISFSLVSRDAHTAGNPPSSICSPLSLSVEYGAQADGMQQLDFDGLVYLKFFGVVIGRDSCEAISTGVDFGLGGTEG
jgi:hypothetical protein